MELGRLELPRRIECVWHSMKLFRSKDESGPFGARPDAPVTARDDEDFTDDVAGNGDEDEHVYVSLRALPGHRRGRTSCACWSMPTSRTAS